MTALDYYGELAKEKIDFTRQNGRYSIQGDAQKHIPQDVIKKIDLKDSDHLLDIGCGLGNNLIPFSFMCDKVTGIDHENIIERLKERFEKENVEYLSGSFSNTNLTTKYDKVVIYSVIHVLQKNDDINVFIDKALKSLKPEGIMIIGDIPNVSRKERFMASDRGREFQKTWDKKMQKAQTMPEPKQNISERDYIIDDNWMANMCQRIRSQGFDTQWLTQNPNLPFGNTREDIVVYGAEYNYK